MICSDPRCTGSHDDRNYTTLCPRTREDKNQRARDWQRAHPEHARERLRLYRTTAAGMLSEARHNAHRRER